MAGKAGVSFMCVYMEWESKAKKKTLWWEESAKKKQHGTFFSLYSANVQLGCSPPASSSIPHYYCDYHARTMLLLHTHTHTLACMREKKKKERKIENVHTWQYLEQSRQRQHKNPELIWKKNEIFIYILR